MVGQPEASDSLRSGSSVFQLSQAGMETDWRLVQRGMREGGVREEEVEMERRISRPQTAPAQSEFLPSHMI